MKQVSRSALLPFSAAQMFAVVNDVAAYQEYLPWCSKSEVLHEAPGEMDARLTISRAGISQSFTTHNESNPPHKLDLHLVEGPFSTLEGRWSFTQLGSDGCKVEMNLRFDFNQAVLNLAFGRVFQQVADSMVDAFCDRAHTLYGRG